MSDLTDEELEHQWRTDDSGGLVRDMVDEIRRHRAAVAADEERVRSVVEDAIGEYTERWDLSPRQIHAIADRAAEQLATAAAVAAGDAVRLSGDDRVRLSCIRSLLYTQPVCWDIEQALLDRLIGDKP